MDAELARMVEDYVDAHTDDLRGGSPSVGLVVALTHADECQETHPDLAHGLTLDGDRSPVYPLQNNSHA